MIAMSNLPLPVDELKEAGWKPARATYEHPTDTLWVHKDYGEKYLIDALMIVVRAKEAAGTK
jgi:hypothetical protein